MATSKILLSAGILFMLLAVAVAGSARPAGAAMQSRRMLQDEALGGAPAAPTDHGNATDTGKEDDPLIPVNAEGTDPGTRTNGTSPATTNASKADPATDTAAELEDDSSDEADWVEDDITPESNSTMEADPNPRKVPLRPPSDGVSETDPNPRKVPVRPPSDAASETDPNPRKVPVRPPEEITDVCLVVCDDGQRFTSPLGRNECGTAWFKDDPRCASTQALQKAAQDMAPRSCRPLDFSKGCELP